MARSIGSKSITKKFKPLYFDNIKIEGILFNEKDLLLCLQLSSFIKTTNIASEEFTKESFSKWLKINFGKFKMTQVIKKVIDNFWNFDADLLVVFNSEKNLDSISLGGKKHFFEIDINLYPKNNNLDAIKKEYESIANKIANLKLFNNSNYIEFKSNK